MLYHKFSFVTLLRVFYRGPHYLWYPTSGPTLAINIYTIIDLSLIIPLLHISYKLPYYKRYFELFL